MSRLVHLHQRLFEVFMEQKIQKRSKKIRKGDRVLVIAGNDKGQTGTVLSCTGDEVLVQGINLCKKHVKREVNKSGFLEIERPIHISNVAPCDENGQRVKVAVQVNSDGSKELIYQKDGKAVVWRSMKQLKQ